VPVRRSYRSQRSATQSGSDDSMREPRFYENPSCAQVGGDLFFPDKDDNAIGSTEIAMAKRICLSCPHQIECADWGIRNERFGIWGGLTESNRRPIRKSLNIILRGEDVA
jgi:WhiB family redox-sensing transcriptional regulator